MNRTKSVTKPRDGKMASLVRLYFQQVDAFNSRVPEDDAEALLDSTASTTMRKMIGVPAVSWEDALAALDWLIKEDAIEMSGDTDFEQTAASIVYALRAYLEGRDTRVN
jgi:hypothetical protein